MSERPIAVFDLDGTLIRGDTFLPFLISFAVRKRRLRPLLVLPFVLAAYACRLLRDWDAKQRLLISFLANRPLADIREHADWFCRIWVSRHLHPIGLRLLREHQAAGHRVILLSASPDVYVPAIGQCLGIDETVCTRVCASKDCCLGTLDGENCKADGKLRMLQQYLGTATPPPDSYGYGDSRHDLPMLRWVQHGTLVTRRGTDLVAQGSASPLVMKSGLQAVKSS